MYTNNFNEYFALKIFIHSSEYFSIYTYLHLTNSYEFQSSEQLTIAFSNKILWKRSFVNQVKNLFSLF